MRTLPGVGKILSALLALEIDDVHRFSHAGKLCAYAGLVPTTYASGGKVRHGRLLPICNRWLRWAFVEAAWAAPALFGLLPCLLREDQETKRIPLCHQCSGQTAL